MSTMVLEDPIDIEHIMTDNDVYAKKVFMKAGAIVPQHAHPYDHLSIVAQGLVQVTVDGKHTIYGAGSHIVVPKNTAHAIQALRTSIWFCIHHCPEKDYEKVDAAILGAK